VVRPTDTHLRSANNVMRYYVHASDGDIGHVQGLLVEDRTWAVRYFIVNTSNWWLGHAVLISPEWIDDVYWAESKLVVSMSRQAVKNSPAYHSNEFDRGQEASLHAHYGYRGYWPLHPLDKRPFKLGNVDPRSDKANPNTPLAHDPGDDDGEDDEAAEIR
jgi:hypothetical protein